MTIASSGARPLSQAQEILLGGISKGMFGAREMNLRFALRIRNIALDRVQSAFYHLNQRHPILQLQLQFGQEYQGKQWIDYHYIEPKIFDASALDPSDAASFIASEVFRPFVVRPGIPSDILFRRMIFTLSSTEMVIAVVGHHVACDHISMKILRDDIIALLELSGANDRDIIAGKEAPVAFFDAIDSEIDNSPVDAYARQRWLKLVNEADFLRKLSEAPKFAVSNYSFNEKECLLVEKIIRASRLTQFGVICGALLCAIQTEFGLTGLAAFRTNVSGRNGKSLRTVGYLTKSVPFLVDFGDCDGDAVKTGRAAINAIRQATEMPVEVERLLHILTRHPIQIVYNVFGGESLGVGVENFPLRVPESQDAGYRFLITIIRKGNQLFFNVNFDASTFSHDTVDRIFDRVRKITLRE